MIERRIIEERIFHPIFGEDGQLPQAPASAMNLYREWREGWYRNYPYLTGNAPAVSVHPTMRNGRKVYVVAKELWQIET